MGNKHGIAYNKKYSNFLTGIRSIGRYNATVKRKKVFLNERYVSRHHAIIHPNMYAKVKALAKAEGISDEEAYDRIMYEAAYYKTI